MDKQIFRKEAMDRISSPEELNDYIKVARPGIWILLVAIIAFLAGISAWGIFGKLETTTQAVVISEGGKATLYVKENSVEKLTDDMTVEIEDTEYKLDTSSTQAVNASELLSSSELHSGDMSEGDWAYTAEVVGNLKDGVYKVTLITEKVNPISFITN